MLVDRAVVEEICATTNETQIELAEFVNEMVEKTYEKLNDNRLKARQKRDELMAK